jgi:hypothetical protein
MPLCLPFRQALIVSDGGFCSAACNKQQTIAAVTSRLRRHSISHRSPTLPDADCEPGQSNQVAERRPADFENPQAVIDLLPKKNKIDEDKVRGKSL